MAKKTNPKLIGGFVVGAIVLAIAGVVAFGGGKFLAKKEKAVLYFENSSLGGLDVGSAVTFRGVKIGAVTGLVIHYDVDNQKLLIPVYVEIETDKIEVVSGHRDVNNIGVLIKRGLRAQLVVQSLVTGQASVDFNFHPETPITLVGGEKGIRELPTIPSDIDLLKANLASVLQKISALPLDQIAEQSLETVKSAKQLLANLNQHVARISDGFNAVSNQASLTLQDVQSRLALSEGEPMQNLNDALLDARRLINNVDKGVAPISADVGKLVKSLLATLDQAQHTLEAAQGTVSPDSTLYFQLVQTLRSIQTTSGSIRAFADYMQRHPDALLLGKH
jgi:paraquat-inducible protein B